MIFTVVYVRLDYMNKFSKSKLARLGAAGLLITLVYYLLASTSAPSFAMMKKSQEYKVGTTTYVTIYAAGDKWNNQGKYYEAKYKIVKSTQVREVYVQALNFYCENTRSDNVCSENGKGQHSIKLNFTENTAYYTIIRYPDNPANCGSFQADLRVVKIALNDGRVYTDTTGITPGKTDINRFVWAACNALNSNFNCGLPENWRTSCSQPPTPTPTLKPSYTPTPTPVPPTSTPLPTPTPQIVQNVSQKVNVNQEVNIQPPPNGKVLGVSTVKQLPKTGVPSIAILSSLTAAGVGIIIRKKLL